MRPIWTEQIIGDAEYKLAGTVDCLFFHPQEGYILTDWKTGKIEEWNTQKFYSPFEKIPCDDLYKYSFQLSLYKIIIERNTDIKISKMHIVHLGGDDYKVITAIDYSNDLGPFLKNRGQ
jgi:ATP-dependent exoDNAse (exonuclease V) beta subunit